MAQHYGFPTNYLDFTFHPLVALHFANARSDSAPPDHSLAGHAVVYQTEYRVARGLARQKRINLHMHLPPPWAMRRWYQQSGIHIDFGPHSSDEEELAAARARSKDFEQRCIGVHFPRSYPDTAEDLLSSAPGLAVHLSAGVDPATYSTATMELHALWNHPQPFFERPLATLARCCGESKRGRLARKSTLDAMQAVMTQVEPPWPLPPADMSPQNLFRLAADPIRVAANYLFEAASFFTTSGNQPGLHLDPLVLVDYAWANPEYFGVLPGIAEKTTLHDLPVISDLVKESVDLHNALIKRFGKQETQAGSSQA